MLVIAVCVLDIIFAILALDKGESKRYKGAQSRGNAILAILGSHPPGCLAVPSWPSISLNDIFQVYFSRPQRFSQRPRQPQQLASPALSNLLYHSRPAFSLRHRSQRTFTSSRTIFSTRPFPQSALIRFAPKSSSDLFVSLTSLWSTIYSANIPKIQKTVTLLLNRNHQS